jgi:hypothetical protein
LGGLEFAKIHSTIFNFSYHNAPMMREDLLMKQLVMACTVWVYVLCGFSTVYAAAVWYEPEHQAIAINPLYSYSTGVSPVIYFDFDLDHDRIGMIKNVEPAEYLTIGMRTNTDSSIYPHTYAWAQWLLYDVPIDINRTVGPNISENNFPQNIHYFGNWNYSEGKTIIYAQPANNNQPIPVINHPLSSYDGFHDATNTYVNIPQQTNGWQKISQVQDGSWFRIDELFDGAMMAWQGVVAVPAALLSVSMYMVSTPPDFITDFLFNSPNSFGSPLYENGATLYTASPAFMWTDFQVTDESSFLTFDFRSFDLSYEDSLFLTIDEEILYCIFGSRMTDLGILDGEWYNSGLIDLTKYIGMNIRLTLGINSTDAGHRVDISNLKFYGQESTAPVPEPSTIVLMGLGLVGLVRFSRKKLKRNL